MIFSFFKSKNVGDTIVFEIEGMHCTACAMNIDGTLEELDGIISASTQYAKSQVKIQYKKAKISKEKMVQTIEELGYTVK